MTESLIEPTPGNGAGDAPGTVPAAATIPESAGGTDGAMPEGLPEKFWDSEAGAVRADSLVKSYLALEQKLGAMAGRAVPDGADGYEIEAPDELFTADPAVNAKLHAAGFSQEQAQTVYDMAAEYMLPMVAEMAAEFHAQAEIDRLAQKFGGEDKWRETAAQLKAWGHAQFPGEVYTALSSTYEGVLTMHKMMSDGESGLIQGQAGGDDGLNEAGLRRMMEDPRYWRDHDPAFVERVRAGFKRLFPD